MLLLVCCLLVVVRTCAARECVLRDFSHFGVVNFSGSVGSHQIFINSSETFEVVFSICSDFRGLLPRMCKEQEELRRFGKERLAEDLPLVVMINKTRGTCQSFYRDDLVYTSSTGQRGAEFYFEPKNKSDRFVALTVIKPNYARGQYDGGTFYDLESPTVMKVGIYLLDFDYSFLDYFKTDLEGQENWIETSFNITWIVTLAVIFIGFSESTTIYYVKPFKIAVTWASFYLLFFSLLEVTQANDSTEVNSLVMYLLSFVLSIADAGLQYKAFSLMKRSRS